MESVETPDHVTSKYPILLVHGMMLKDFFFLHAFCGIKKRLTKRNINIYIAKHDGIGSIENNAEQLKKQIMEILQKENTDKINIIAHSKGGLDARYMISKLSMSHHVASLTTLSTPHYGSKMSRKILTMPSFFAKSICFFINIFYRVFGDRHPDLMTVARQLCDTEMTRFNMEVINSDNVYYQSYSSDISNTKVFLMFVPYKFSKYCEGEETDGIVAVSSSKWGNYRGNMDVSANHLQMVGVLGGKKSLNEVSKFYVKIITELAGRGL